MFGLWGRLPHAEARFLNVQICGSHHGLCRGRKKTLQRDTAEVTRHSFSLSLHFFFFFPTMCSLSESCTHLLPLFADLHVTPCDGFQVRRLHPSPRRPTSNLMPLPFSFFCRFWIRELLPARGASDHVVREPAVRRPRGLRGSAVRGSSARYLGEGRFQLLRFRVHSWSRSRSPVSRDCPKSATSKKDRRMNFARLRRVQ